MLLASALLCHGAQAASDEALAEPIEFSAQVPAIVAPAFSLPALDGPAFALSELKGRVSIIHFFATWCAPCRRELPALRQVAARLAGEGVAVILVDVAEGEARVRRVLGELSGVEAAAGPAPWRVLMDRDRAVARAWDVTLLPSSFVLGPDLAIRLAASGEVAWGAPQTEAALRHLLAEPEAPAKRPEHHAEHPISQEQTR